MFMLNIQIPTANYLVSMSKAGLKFQSLTYSPLTDHVKSQQMSGSDRLWLGKMT